VLERRRSKPDDEASLLFSEFAVGTGARLNTDLLDGIIYNQGY
jgi:hypothetical protein